MTQPPTAPPAPPPPPVPAVPDSGTPGAHPDANVTSQLTPSGGGRRTAWAESVHRIRAAAVTEPGRLRLIGAVVATLVVLFGAVTAWQVSDRVEAADAVVDHSQPLSADAARIYRSLADADTSASSGFLAGGDEPRSERRRYEKDVREASELLAAAAANSADSPGAQRQIGTLNRGLPVYTGLVEAARANNRQGLPLGGAYLRHANAKMRGELLPAARKLYTAETERLGNDYQDAKSWPLLAIGAGVLTLVGLGWAQRRNYRRTNRVFNQGLLGATAASLAVLVWLVGGHAMARSGLGESDTKGASSLAALNEAWIGALQARGDENMTLVARGGGAAYEDSYKKQMADVAGGEKAGDGGAGELNGALRAADDSAGRSAVQDAKDAVATWKKRHAEARAEDNGGDYEAAVRKVIGAKDSTGQSFDDVDESLSKASAHEQRQFEDAARSGRGWFGGLAMGAMVLAVLSAAAGLLGIGRRLSEYR
ncbi:hypothetical protein OIE63_26560 [Streptomyces sp. NBC_01795]|uniref:hypothetical protein n=1 Tax=unclassified Streptomyces TaxID=2593676 RepID=UPI002DD96CB9|nr:MULTISPECIES: hypothetical protein [unclassified Streptomyces]WSA94730.1 hypothetical protein OIE63_26560 [Streptomyces sp. NBC_01795]WSB79150.1 hypothetical protein OHB04_27675 [Streptomyces sp. NBC_01775]WSS12648.1 hypothetical protein OG533_12545 [Streptomyces sp. NBC_01186]